MSFFKKLAKKLTGAGKKLADPLGIVNKKNRINLKNWKDPLELGINPKNWKDPMGLMGGGRGGPGKAGMPGGMGPGGGGPPGQGGFQGNGPLSMGAFMGLMPSIMGGGGFANPHAASWLARTMGYQPQQQRNMNPAVMFAGPNGGQPGWSNGGASPFQGIMQKFLASRQPGADQNAIQPVPEDGKMYAGGNPNFDESGGGAQFDAFGNVFGGQPGPMAGFGQGMRRPFMGGGLMGGGFGGIGGGGMMGPGALWGMKQYNRYAGPYGNGGGGMVPNPFMQAGLRNMYGTGGSGGMRTGGYDMFQQH